MNVNKKIVLRFSAKVVEDPIIYALIKDYNLIPNILKAEINPHKEGYLVVEVVGKKEKYTEALAYLEQKGISVEPLDERVVWIEEKCIQCGLCTGLCPTQALKMNRPDMNVTFHGEKCIVCGICVKCCPVQAVELHF